MSKKSRRQFLQLGCASSMALKFGVIESILNGLYSQALAQHAGANIKNFIHFSLPGGPPRWLFDLPIRPSGNDPIVANPMIITRFTQSNITSADLGSYNTVNINGLSLPTLWGSRVPNASGGSNPLSQLAQHMIFIRGMNTGSDGHLINRVRMNAPIGGAPSVNGLFADKSNTPIPAVRRSVDLRFKSNAGKGEVNATGSNPLTTLLSPFNISGNPYISNAAQTNDLNAIMQSIAKYTSQTNPFAASLIQDNKNALDLLKQGVGELGLIFTNLRDKYNTIIQECMIKQWINDVDNVDIVSPDVNNASTFSFRLQSGGNRLLLRNRNMREMISQNTTVANLADCCAMIEYLVVNKLSSSITTGIGNLSNINVMNALNIESGASVNGNIASDNDAHNTGAYATLFFFSKYYLAFSACLLELVRSLKSAGEFNNSLIQISSEFNRSAKSNAGGSDHGWRGSNISLISGRITQPECIGNISREGTSNNHLGTWGVAARNPSMNNREIGLGNMVSTVSNILGIQSVTSNDQPLVNSTPQSIQATLSRGRNV
jgi:hypothetical protein